MSGESNLTCPCADPVGGPPCTADNPCPYAEGMPAARWGHPSLAVGDTVVETTPSGREHIYTVTAVDVQPKQPAAPEGRYVVITCGHVHHTMRQEDIFAVDWMVVA